MKKNDIGEKKQKEEIIPKKNYIKKRLYKNKELNRKKTT